MPFEPGHQRLGGRRPGVPNKATAEARAFARRLLEHPDYVKSLRKRLLAGDAGNVETLLWHYAWGKPQSENASQGPSDDVAATLARILARQEGHLNSGSAVPDGEQPSQDGQ